VIRTEVAVVGGGMAGLACAAELADAGRDALLLEASPRVGGVVETARRDGFVLERAAITVRGGPELDRLARRAGVELIRARMGTAWVVASGRLVRPSPGALLRGELLPRVALVQMAAEPFRRSPPGPRTVRQLVRQRLGPLAAERVADLLTLGTYGASADQIGFEAAFPDLADEIERGHSLTRIALSRLLRRGGEGAQPSGLVSTARGLGALPEALERRLGERVRTRVEVRRVERVADGFALDTGEQKVHARSVVLAVPPARAVALVDDAEASRLLAEFTATPQALATFAIEEPAVFERWNGFGFLSPPREGQPLLGALFPNRIFPEHGPAGTLLVTAFVAPRVREASEAGIAGALSPVLSRLLGCVHEPTLLAVARHPVGIPRYDPQHPARTAALRARLAELDGPALAGWGYDGIGVAAAVRSGLDAARRAISSSA
jgi:oxygen-dependent protoporphyrinogen oxidase